MRSPFALGPFALGMTILLFVPIAAAAPRTIKVPQDYQTIQAAIDASESGATVLVSPGTYREHIRMREGVTLRSAGDDAKGELGLRRSEATIIDGGGVAGTGPGVVMALNSTLDGFTVRNIGVYDEASWNRHAATQGNEQSHEHIGAPGEAGIEVNGVNCTIRYNIVHHIGYTGIGIRGSSEGTCAPHLYRNVCYRNMGGGIGSMHGSAALIEENTCFQNFYAGIGHDDASPTVVNNICYENIRAGIGISEGSCPTVTGNTCFKNHRAGIGTRTGADTRPIISGNECYENGMAGIGTEEDASPVIKNNRCYRNKLAGIGSRTRATPTIIGNECFENGTSGIAQESDARTTLINNHCHHNKASGVGFAACDSGRSTMMNNRIIENATVAAGIHAGWEVRLLGNELSRQAGMAPIIMVFAGAKANLTGNVIRGGGVAGIRVAGQIRADDNEFDGTMLRPSGPPNFAVWALPGSEVHLSGNRISQWRHAVHADRAKVSAQRNHVRSFHKTAFVIRQAPAEPTLIANTAIAIDEADQIVSITGKTGVVRENKLLLSAPD